MDVKIKWWGNVRGQCQRSYCCDSPALSVICNLDRRFSNFTVGLMLGALVLLIPFSCSDQVISIKQCPFGKVCFL